MKLRVEFTKNNEPVPFTYVSNLNGYLHKILGNNNKYHDDLSLYSTSFLHGGKAAKDKKTLDFSKGAIWYISSPDNQFIDNFVRNAYQNIEFAFGMELRSINVIETKLKNDGGFYSIRTKSPILLKQKDYVLKRNNYYTYMDSLDFTSTLMKNLVIKKAEKFGLKFNADDFDVFFDYEYQTKKIKWIVVKSISNKTSICPILIKTKNSQIAEFIYDIGIGHSTGSGFGFLL